MTGYNSLIIAVDIKFSTQL